MIALTHKKLLLSIYAISIVISAVPLVHGSTPLSVSINLNDYAEVFEGDIISCNITGNPIEKYWKINDNQWHTSFIGNNPVIFNPEPTPLGDEYVNLTVMIKDAYGNTATDTVSIKLYKLWFGDIHWHSNISDGKYALNEDYQNIIQDNYLDFACSTEHNYIDMSKYWAGAIKENVTNFYNPGNFTTLRAYEWTTYDNASWNCHINVYYRSNGNEIDDVYMQGTNHNFTELFSYYYNHSDVDCIMYPHHPLAYPTDSDATNFQYVNFSYLHDKLTGNALLGRNIFLKGVECYSGWGAAICGPYTPEIPYHRHYTGYDPPDDIEKYCWVEAGLWEWSENSTKGLPFTLIASSDSHRVNRAGSVLIEEWSSCGSQPDGLLAVFSVHNTREEIYDNWKKGNAYGVESLKIRVNVRAEGKIAIGRWINVTDGKLDMLITANATFNGNDSSGKTMLPYGDGDDIRGNITNIWVVKKDKEKGFPYCRVVAHASPMKPLCALKFEDSDVKANDFYYVVVEEKWNYIGTSDRYRAYIGGFFIYNVGNESTNETDQTNQTQYSHIPQRIYDIWMDAVPLLLVAAVIGITVPFIVGKLNEVIK